MDLPGSTRSGDVGCRAVWRPDRRGGVEGQPMFAEIGDFNGSGGFKFFGCHVVDDGAA